MRTALTALVVTMLVALPCGLSAQLSRMKATPGSQHGFLVLRNTDGAVIASGELLEIPNGDRTTVRLVFHFRDGSLNDETTVYATRTQRLVHDRLIQRGPSFPEPLDFTIDMPTGQVSLRGVFKGKQVETTEHMDLPPDLANGVIYGLIQSLPPDSPKIELPYLAPEAKPRMVKLAVTPETGEAFKVGGRAYNATKFVVKVNLGGLEGVVAPMIGKQPADTSVWVLKSGVPTIVRVDGSLYDEGPIWSIQLASPVW